MKSRPNILFIFPDQWRGDCLGYLGHPVVETPFLDQLAAEGTTFINMYSPAPTCIPTRATLITGQTPNSCGRIGFQDGVPWRYENTLMHCLRDGGYQTMGVGVNHFFPRRVCLGFETFRHYYSTLHASKIEADFIKSDYHTWLEHESNGMTRDTLDELSAQSWLAQPWAHPEHLHPNTWTVDTAIDLLARRDPTRPFYLYVGFHRPHPPFDPPIRYYQMYADKELPPVPVGDWAQEFDAPVKAVDVLLRGRLPDHQLTRTRKAYYAQLSHIDYQIGRLLHWLKMKDLLDDTYILFSSDHGEMLGDHHLFEKKVPFEGSAKVPLILKPPPWVEWLRDTRVDSVVSHMDVMPTLLDLAGIKTPDAVEGLSTLPVIMQERKNWRTFIHGEHATTDKTWQFLTDGKEKFIWEGVSGREWFFDLVSDPQERTDLSQSEEHVARIGFWRQQLVEILAKRPEDGLSDGKKLIPGRLLSPVRSELLQGLVTDDGGKSYKEE